MIMISHRGNMYGPDPQNENKPEYIIDALRNGFDVEIDVWSIDNDFYLGHDKPQYKVDWKFLTNPAFWCHAKDVDTFYKLLKTGSHCFFHQNDNATLTSKGFIWTYPGKILTPMSICVMPEINNYSDDLSKAKGVCSDFIMEIKSGNFRK